MFLIVSVVLAGGVSILIVWSMGYFLPATIDRMNLITPTPERETVALVSGHTGFDSGAICGTSNDPTLREVEVVARVAELVRVALEEAGLEVLMLEEYDERLENLDTALLLSLHADSCISASGYKAASPLNSAIPNTEQRLIACINSLYGAHTGLALHANSITHDMTYYHAFRKVLPTTPSAILELGFLEGIQGY